MPRPTPTAREKARLERERKWLEAKVAKARPLTDEDRVRIVCDLERAEAARRARKDAKQLAREEQVRSHLDRQGKDRYRALVERWFRTNGARGSSAL